jgi:hypothetical protein
VLCVKEEQRAGHKITLGKGLWELRADNQGILSVSAVVLLISLVRSGSGAGAGLVDISALVRSVSLGHWRFEQHYIPRCNYSRRNHSSPQSIADNSTTACPPEVIAWREYVMTINDNAKSSKQYRDNTLVK